ncbi:MAG: hypothetical protein ACXU9J_03025 [Syntrophales bacterium]
MIEESEVTYLDSKLSFYIQIYREKEYAFTKVKRLRSFYPEARIIVRSDGGDGADFPWHRLNVEFFDEKRLFPFANGGMVVQRMLSIFLERPSEYLIKIDPDTAHHRRLHYLPKCNGLFGTLQMVDDCVSIQGGFIGISLRAAEEIASSKLLLEPCLREPDESQGGYFAILRRRAQRVGLTSFDWTLGWAATHLNLPMTEYNEVSCAWKIPPNNINGEFAFTHPDIYRL